MSRPGGAPRTLSRSVLMVAATIAAIFACDTTGDPQATGCLRVHQGDYGFPVKRIVAGSMAARLTQAGSDVVTERIGELVLAFFDADEEGHAILALDDLGIGELTTSLGPVDGALRDAILTLDLSALDLELLPGTSPARMTLTVTEAELGVEQAVVSGAIDLGIAGGDLACALSEGEAGYLAIVSFALEITLATDSEGGLAVGVEVLDVQIHDVSASIEVDCELEECQDGCSECQTLCEAGELIAGIGDGLVELLGALVNDLSTFLSDQIGAALIDALLNGKPIAVEGTLDVAALGGGLLPWLRDTEPLGVLVRPAADAFEVTGVGGSLGLEIDLDAGVDALEAHPCVGDPGAEPIFEAAGLPPWPDLLTDPDGSQRPYHMGLAISGAWLNEALWAAWKAGILCVDLESRDIAELTQGTVLLTASALELLLPGLSSIAGPHAPVRFRLRPRFDTWPAVDLDDPITGSPLGVHLADVHISLDVGLSGAWLRVLDVTTDLALGLRIEALEGARLGLTVETVDVGSLDADPSELLSYTKMEVIVPFVVDLAVGLVTQEAIELELDTSGLVSGALGVPLEPVIERIEVPQGWLRILLSLEVLE